MATKRRNYSHMLGTRVNDAQFEYVMKFVAAYDIPESLIIRLMIEHLRQRNWRIETKWVEVSPDKTGGAED